MAGLSSTDSVPVPRAKDSLEPFQIVIDILNKDEVMANKVGNWWGVSAVANFVVTKDTFATKVSEKLCTMIPEKLKDHAGLDLSMVENKAEKEGTHFVLDVQILGFDLKVLGEKALGLDSNGASRFVSAFDAILGALTSMGLVEKADEINSNIANKVRNKIMEKMLIALPAKLGEEGVKIDIVIPECQASLEAAETAESAALEAATREAEETAKLLGLGEPFEMLCVIEDRHALVDEVIQPGLGSRIKKFAANHIPDDKFNEIVGKKLETKVPEALEEKAGIKASCERIAGDEKMGIHVRMKVISFDINRLLSMAKGQDFADGYDSAVSSLKTLSELGLKGIDEKLNAITAKASGTVCDTVREKLAVVLAEKLHAKVETL